MTSYFLDTNIILRAVVGDRAEQTKDCDDFFALTRISAFSTYTSSTVFAEAVWTLQSFYKFPRAKIGETLRSFEASGIARDDRANISLALGWYEKYSVKFVDALIASNPAMQSGAMTLVSYDRDFDKLGITRVEPREVVRRYV